MVKRREIDVPSQLRTPADIAGAIRSKVELFAERNDVFGASCDVTFKLSVQEIQESPVLIEMLPNVALSEADSADEVWTVASTGAVKKVTPTVALALTGDNSWGGGDSNKFEIAIYNPTPDVDKNALIDTYFEEKYPL